MPSLPLTHVPLAPFDAPHPQRCRYRWVDDDGDPQLCGKLRHSSVHTQHEFDPMPYVQRRDGSRDDRIDPDKHYLARIHGRWYLGQFDEQWYGWNFDGWGGAGYQLDSIEDLYEVDLGALP